jgi:hypothetical protein
MMMHFVKESLTAKFHQQWQTVAAPLVWAHPMTARSSQDAKVDP